MLLDRQRVRFWQRWIFLFMAILMAGFLIFGYSGVIGSCSRNQQTQRAGNPYNDQVNKALAALKASPNDATALSAAAQAYQTRGFSEPDGSVVQQQDLQQALTYFEHYLKLPDKALGAGAKATRLAVLANDVTAIYSKLNLPGKMAATYRRLTLLDPKNPDYLAQYGAYLQQAGNPDTALLVFEQYLQRFPTSPNVADIKTTIVSLKAQILAQHTPQAQPSPTPKPSPTASK